MNELGLPLLPEQDLDHAYTVVGERRWRKLSGKRLFVTGGTGFVGKWLLASLIDADRRLGLNCRMTVLSRRPDLFSKAVPTIAGSACVTLLRGDVRDFEFPGGQFDVIIHGATDVIAQTAPWETFSTCVDGTRRAIDFAEHCGANDFLLTSSGAIYGRQPADLQRMPESYMGGPDPLLPSSAYGEGKRVSEWLACTRAAESRLRVKIARIYAQVGPYLPLDKHFAIGNFIADAMAGKEIVVKGDGTPFRSYLYAADMAAWLWAVLVDGRQQTAYNVGGEEAVSIGALARRVADLLEPNAAIRILKEAALDHVPERYVPDVRRATDELNLRLPIGLDEAILRTALWHRQHSASSP